jgi:hypothetical protein
MSDAREHVHNLINRLPDEQLAAISDILETMLQPGKEEIGEDEERAVAEARQWLRDNGGKGIPHEEVLGDFGLTLDDFGRMGEERAKRRRG